MYVFVARKVHLGGCDYTKIPSTRVKKGYSSSYHKRPNSLTESSLLYLPIHLTQHDLTLATKSHLSTPSTYLPSHTLSTSSNCLTTPSSELPFSALHHYNLDNGRRCC